MSIIAYAKAKTAGGHAEISRQQEQIKALATLLGLPKPDRWMQDEGMGVALTDLVNGVILSPSDTLMIAEPSVLGATPSEMLANATTLVGKGVRVLVAAGAGEIDLAGLRTYAEWSTALEAELAATKAELAKARREHEIELDAFADEYERNISEALRARGITLGSLLRPANASQPDNAVEGRRVREQREAMGLTQEQAGQLVETHRKKPALAKPAVSRIEKEGSGAAHYQDYRLALQIEYAKRVQAKAKAKADKPAPVAAVPSDEEIAALVVAEAGVAS